MIELLDFTNLNTLFVLLALAGFAYLCWQKPMWGIYGITAGLPSYLIRLRFAGLPMTFLELAVLILFATWLFKKGRWKRIDIFFWRRTENAVPKPFRMPLALILIGSFLGMVVSANQPHAFGIFKAYFVEPILFLIVFVYEVRTRKELERVFLLLGALTILVGLIALWQYLTGAGILNPFWANPLHRRVTTFFGYPNAASLLVGPIVAFYLGYLLKANAPLLKIYMVLVIIFGLIVIITAKTAGALLAIATIMWLILFLYRNTRSLIVALSVIMITLAINTSQLQGGWTQFRDRVARDYLDLRASSLEIRISQWKETIRLIADRPIFGAGLAGYQQAVQPYHRHQFLEIYLYPHNLILNFWTEVGLIGLVGFVWLLVATGGGIARIRRRENLYFKYGLLLAWLVILIHGMVDVPYFKNDLSVLWMLFVGATISSTQLSATS